MTVTQIRDRVSVQRGGMCGQRGLIDAVPRMVGNVRKRNDESASKVQRIDRRLETVCAWGVCEKITRGPGLERERPRRGTKRGPFEKMAGVAGAIERLGKGNGTIMESSTNRNEKETHLRQHSTLAAMAILNPSTLLRAKNANALS